MSQPNCSDFFDCEDPMSLEQALKNMIVKDENGCPALKIIPVDAQTPVTRTATRTEVSSSGNVSAGAKSVTFETDGDFQGTIMGATAQPNSWYSFSVQGANEVLAAMSYTITAGKIYINKIV